MTSASAQQSPVNENYLTRVETLFIEGQLNFRLLFGHPAKVVENEFTYGQRTRKTAYFKAGDIFALDLWQRNEHGTTAWAVYVLQAAAPGETGYPVPQVRPAAKILLEAVGVERARHALALLKEIEERTDPTTLPANRYLLTDFRLKACQRNRRLRRY